MRPARDRVVRSLLRPLGWTATPVGPGLYVEPADAATPAVLRRLGPESLHTTLLTRKRRTRRHRQRNAYEMALLKHAATEHLVSVLNRLSINVVLDVGANRGQSGRRLRRIGYRGRIVSFEPVSSLFARLEEACQDDPEWLAFPWALGDETGSRQINVAGPLSSMLPASEFGREWKKPLEHPATEEIAIRRLEDVYEQVVAGIARPRVFLKMDTQGFDLEAFRGAGANLDDIRGLKSEVACVPLYEGMRRFPEQLAEYERAGFEITGMFPVSRHVRSMRIIEFDLVMVRQRRGRRRVSPSDVPV